MKACTMNWHAYLRLEDKIVIHRQLLSHTCQSQALIVRQRALRKRGWLVSEVVCISRTFGQDRKMCVTSLQADSHLNDENLA